MIADIGGMYAASWCRLALHFKNEIQQGQVRFLVTNINLDKSNIAGAFTAEMKADPLDERTQQSFLAGNGLVEWHKMNVSEFWEQFKDQIDIAHERTSLTHSLIPDIDFPMIGQTLRKDGFFISTSKDPHPSSSDYYVTHRAEIVQSFEQSMQTMDTKYHRLLSDRTNTTVWSPDAQAERYFHAKNKYPVIIKYTE
jgi:hypothetical protein